MDAYMAKLENIQLCGIKTIYWRQFLKAIQESTTDEQARIALARLKQRIQAGGTVPSEVAQAALSIVTELEQLLDLGK
ncbi:MAG: hypothetical protein DCC67_08345 [Planctomycetota bacterium]|nr:MAG: hypothetical protein DCC67_08345 [Planctomycetota bacterium]